VTAEVDVWRGRVRQDVQWTAQRRNVKSGGSGDPRLDSLVLRPIGWVESPLRSLEEAPLQGDEGAPDAVVVFEPPVRDAPAGLQLGADVLLITWLDRADREVLVVHPRGDPARPLTGVFSTRSPDRANPLGLHRVTVLAVDGLRVRVQNLEALDGTPVVDVKPVLDPGVER
jgi:tRNA-Thr(GGU) m(6)t(6)A37 methyltransferase TsaA